MSRSSTISSALQNFKIDEIIECKSGSTFFPAKILQIDKSGGSTSYLVHYQNWNKRFDEWVPAGRLRKNKSVPVLEEKMNVELEKRRILRKSPKTSTPIAAKAKKNEKPVRISNSSSKSPSPIKKTTKSLILPKPILERLVEDDLVVYRTSNGKRFLTLDEIQEYCRNRKFQFRESDYNFLVLKPKKSPKIAKKISVVKKTLKKRESQSPTIDKSPILGKRLRKLNQKYVVDETPSKHKKRGPKKIRKSSVTPKKARKVPKSPGKVGKTSLKPGKVGKAPEKVEKTPKTAEKVKKPPKTKKIDVSNKKRKSTTDSTPKKAKKPKLVGKTPKNRKKDEKPEIIPAQMMEQPVECVEVQETEIVGQMGSPIDERLPKILLDKSQQPRKKTFSESSTSKLPDMTDTQHKGFSLGLYQSATSKLYAQQTQMKSGVYVQLAQKPKGFTLSPSTSPPIVGLPSSSSKRNFQTLQQQQQMMRYDQHGLPIITDAEIEEGLRSVDGRSGDASSLMAAFSAAESLTSATAAGQRSMSLPPRRSGQRSLSGGWSYGGDSSGGTEFPAQRRRVARVSPRDASDNVESMDGDFSIPIESRFSPAGQYQRRPVSFHQFSSNSSSSFLGSGGAGTFQNVPHQQQPVNVSPPVFHYLPPEVCGDHCYGRNRSSVADQLQQRPLTVVTSLTTNKQQATSVRIQLAPATTTAGVGGSSLDVDFSEQNRHASTLMSPDISSPMLSGGMTSPLYQQQHQAPPPSTRMTSPPSSPLPQQTTSASSFAAAYEIMGGATNVVVGVVNVDQSNLSSSTTSSSVANRNQMPANILEGEDESDSFTPPATMTSSSMIKSDDQSPEVTSVIID